MPETYEVFVKHEDEPGHRWWGRCTLPDSNDEPLVAAVRSAVESVHKVVVAADNGDSVKSPPRPDEVPAPLGLDGPGFYFQRYSDGEWLGPYETIPALAKALDLSDYPGNGHIVEWDGEVCGAVPSLNPDDLQPDVQRDGLTTAERQHIEFYNSYGVPVQWFVGKRRDNGDIEVIGLGENFAWSLLLNGEQCNTSEATLGEFNTGIEI